MNCESRPKGSEEGARRGEETFGESAPEPLRRGSKDFDREGARSEVGPLSGICTECHVQL